jgi:hypothetical protein
MFERYPPHILSFPGAGNAWLRLLIEYSTGVYTGSMGTDDYEFLGPGGFVGERSCGLRLAAIRAHPHFFDFLNGKLRFAQNNQRDKCKRGLVRELKRMIILLRNPYDTLWANYQLVSSLSHAEYLTTESFDASTWMFTAPVMAKHYDAELYRIVKPIIDTFPAEDVTLVRYEDLVDPAKRHTALRNVLSFMKYNVTEERLQCAFLLADKPFVHRNAHDPHRVAAKTAYLLTRDSVPDVLAMTGEISTAASSKRASTHYNNLFCELREPFLGFAKVLNYTLTPAWMDPAAAATLCEVAPVKV